ncbi:MAG: zinc ribbon domain-containing protein [Gemmatimonadaceae bacterium]|nr:zinc ribbon domain-containing protein [Gemmatimonadaceae bacterium]
MTVVSRSLDDLDRLAFRLSRTVRTQYPHLLSQGFTLTDLEERLLPFREVRREMANAGPDAFESSMLRLIAGERGYVATEAALQEAARKALLLPSPSISLVRAWATTQLQLVSTSITPSRSATPVSVEVFPMPSGFSVASGVITPVAVTCRYCDSRLPQGRKITYCPHCGMDLSKKQCPACSTELEVGWKHCVTCGRKDEA